MPLFRAVMDAHVADKFVLSDFPQTMEQLEAFEAEVTAARFALRLGGAASSPDVARSLSATGRLRDVQTGASADVVAQIKAHFRPKIVLAVGAAGSGCAEHSESAARRFGYTLLDVVDVLACEVDRRSPLGTQARAMMEKSQILPIDLKLRMLRDAMVASGDTKFVVSGFPGALDHYRAFVGRFGPPAMALYFKADDAACRARLIEDGCDAATADRKLEIFRSQTMPAVGAMARHGVLRIVDACAPPGEVRRLITAHFKMPVVVALGDGAASPSEISRLLQDVADDAGYAYLDAGSMFAEAMKQGTFEGKRLKRGKSTESEVLVRAGDSCGKSGVVLRGFPSGDGHVGDLLRAFQAPKLVVRFHCPGPAASAV